MSHRAALEHSAAISLREWAQWPEDEQGELYAGQKVEEEMPDFVHEMLVILLGRVFADWILPLGGFVAGSDAKFAVGAERGRKPDLTVFFPGRKPPRRGLIEIPPDLAVEIVSSTPRDGRRDRVEKTADYAAFGIRFYWILDPELRSLEILELGAFGRYTHALGATDGRLAEIPGCAGLVLDLDALWAEVDRLDEG